MITLLNWKNKSFKISATRKWNHHGFTPRLEQSDQKQSKKTKKRHCTTNTVKFLRTTHCNIKLNSLSLIIRMCIPITGLWILRPGLNCNSRDNLGLTAWFLYRIQINKRINHPSVIGNSRKAKKTKWLVKAGAYQREMLYYICSRLVY